MKYARRNYIVGSAISPCHQRGDWRDSGLSTVPSEVPARLPPTGEWQRYLRSTEDRPLRSSSVMQGVKSHDVDLQKDIFAYVMEVGLLTFGIQDNSVDGREENDQPQYGKFRGWNDSLRTDHITWLGA